MEPITLFVSVLLFTFAISPLVKKSDDGSEAEERIKVLEELNTNQKWCEAGKDILSKLRENYQEISKETLEAGNPGYQKHKYLTQLLLVALSKDEELRKLFSYFTSITLKNFPIFIRQDNKVVTIVINQKEVDCTNQEYYIVESIEVNEYSSNIQGSGNQVNQGNGNTVSQNIVDSNLYPSSDPSNLNKQKSLVSQEQQRHKRPHLTRLSFEGLKVNVSDDEVESDDDVEHERPVPRRRGRPCPSIGAIAELSSVDTFETEEQPQVPSESSKPREYPVDDIEKVGKSLSKNSWIICTSMSRSQLSKAGSQQNKSFLSTC